MVSPGLRQFVLRFREPARKRKVAVFFLCVLLSTIFWLVIRLSREAQAEFRVPLIFHGIPEEEVLLEQGANELHFVLQASGMKLLASRFQFPKDSLSIHVNALARINRNGQEYRMLTSGHAANRLSTHLGPGSSLLRVWPDSVVLRLVPASKKKLPLVPDVRLDFENRFGLYGNISLDPDSATIRGPSEMVDTMTVLYTNELSFSGLNKSVESPAHIRLPLIHPSVRINPPYTTVHIQVAEFTETSVELPLTVSCPDSLKRVIPEGLRLFPPVVEVICLVALQDYHRIDFIQFEAYVLCPGEDTPDGRLQVKLKHVPPYLQVKDIRPASVEYLIWR
jgi:hypothetical protein